MIPLESLYFNRSPCSFFYIAPSSFCPNVYIILCDNYPRISKFYPGQTWFTLQSCTYCTTMLHCPLKTCMMWLHHSPRGIGQQERADVWQFSGASRKWPAASAQEGGQRVLNCRDHVHYVYKHITIFSMLSSGSDSQ